MMCPCVSTRQSLVMNHVSGLIHLLHNIKLVSTMHPGDIKNNLFYLKYVGAVESHSSRQAKDRLNAKDSHLSNLMLSFFLRKEVLEVSRGKDSANQHDG